MFLTTGLKTVVLILLVLLCAGTTCYSHFMLHGEVVLSLLFYVPTALAGLWWGTRGAWVGALLAALLLISHLLSGLGTPNQEDVVQAVTLVVVGLTVGLLREQALRSEKSLRETQDYLNSLIRCAYAPSIACDQTLRITRFDAALERLMGYTASEVIGQELPMLFPEASQDESLSKVARALGGDHWNSVEIPIRCRDGETRPLLWNSVNIYAEGSTTLLATIAQGQGVTTDH